MAKVRQLLIGLASSSALYSGLVPALGLGDITLRSALSQPLDAEIEFFEVGDLTDADMRVNLAPAEVFSRNGVERQYFYNDLRFTPLLRGGKTMIRVVSTKPVREPYLNFIVEVVRPNGKFYREYTILLDPPDSAAYRSLAASAPAVTTAAPQAAAEEPLRPAVLPAALKGNTYAVANGDTLWTIARRLAADDGQQSAQALMNDLYALNPQAFINGDINRLRAVAQLLLPDSIKTAAPEVADTSGAQESAPAEAVAVPVPASPSPELPLEPAAEVLAPGRMRPEEESASQSDETLQLQKSVEQLGLQLLQLQEQMSARDQNMEAQMSARDQLIAGLQAELAASRRNAENLAAAAAAITVQSPPVASNSGSNWLAAIAALLALLVGGVAGLLWRGRKSVESTPVASEPVMTSDEPIDLDVTPSERAEVPAVSLRDKADITPAWPASSEDALQSANVYIAYGRLNEAASLLRNTWQVQPQRHDIGFRLLEVLARLGDSKGFVAQEALLREAGFDPARIDEVKVQHAGLFDAPQSAGLEDLVLQLDEAEEASVKAQCEDVQLNLDDMSLDADWDLVSPFAPAGLKKVASSAAEKEKDEDAFKMSDGLDARSPFAESMLVEEGSHDDWNGEELNVNFLDDFEHLAGSQDNLSKLNMALAYIEQGSLVSACQILNEVIDDGDEEQKQEARQLLAKIA